MNDGRNDAATGSSTPREAPLNEGHRSRENIYSSEHNQTGYHSREELERPGPRLPKFVEEFEGPSIGERLSEGGRGEMGREAAGEGSTGNDHLGNDRVGNQHADFHDVPLDNGIRQPEEALPASPRHPVGRSLSPRSAVSSLHEGRVSRWERRPTPRPATGPEVAQPTVQRRTGHVEPSGSHHHLEPTPTLPVFVRLGRSLKSFPSRVYTTIKRHFNAHPILTIISLLVILLALSLFIYLLTRFIPWVVHLLKLKAYIDSKLAKLDEWKGKIDEFKDQVVGKFRDWLGDGKALADNVKDKVKEKVNSGIDKINGAAGKLGVKIGYVDRRDVVGPAGVIGIAGRAVGRRGLLGNLGSLWDMVHDEKAETMAVTSEVTTTTAASWEPSSTWRSSSVVWATETNGAIARRGKIPLPFVLLVGLAGLARGEEHFPKVSDQIRTTSLESQATPTLATATISTKYTSTSTTTPDLHNAGLQKREPGGVRGSGSGSGRGNNGNQNKDKTPEFGQSNNHTSSALGHRAYLPYPILILGNILRYARAEIVNPIEEFPPASTAALSSTTGASSALLPRQNTNIECFEKAKSYKEVDKCCYGIESPLTFNACLADLNLYLPRDEDGLTKEDNPTDEGESPLEQPRDIGEQSTTNGRTGASGGAKSVLGESLVSSTVFTTSTAAASTDEERIEPTSTETANLAVRRFGGLFWW